MIFSFFDTTLPSNEFGHKSHLSFFFYFPPQRFLFIGFFKIFYVKKKISILDRSMS